MYEIRFDNNVIDYLEKLPKEISFRIFKKLNDTKENPYRYFVRLSQREEYKLRVGDYRIIADIDNFQCLILVRYINHRSRVYDKF